MRETMPKDVEWTLGPAERGTYVLRAQFKDEDGRRVTRFSFDEEDIAPAQRALRSHDGLVDALKANMPDDPCTGCLHLPDPRHGGGCRVAGSSSGCKKRVQFYKADKALKAAEEV